jgi:hypothetical protein
MLQSLAMTEYHILQGHDADDLSEQVTAQLKDGWQLVGAPFTGKVDHLGMPTVKFFQALAK